MGATAWIVEGLIDRARLRFADARHGEALADLDEAERLAEARDLAGPLATLAMLRETIAPGDGEEKQRNEKVRRV